MDYSKGDLDYHLTFFTSYKKYSFSEFTNHKDFKKFYYIIGRDHRTRKVLALYYTDYKYKFYDEVIGTLPNNFQTEQIEEIFKRHRSEMIETFNKIGDHKIPRKHSMFRFKTERENVVNDKIRLGNQREAQINCLLEETKNRMMFDHFLQCQFSSAGKDFHKFIWQPYVEGSTQYFRDKEWSLEASIARILCVNPYSKIFYPQFIDLVGSFYRGRSNRKEIIKNLDFYELYFENKLIFRKTGDKSICRNKQLYLKLCEPVELNGAILKVVGDILIDKKFIQNAITKEYVPDHCRKKLEKYEGLSLMKAIFFKSRIFGDFKKVEKIMDEFRALDSQEKKLFSSIETICNKKENCHRTEASISEDEGNKLQKINKYLTGSNLTLNEGSRKNPTHLKLKAIYNYLSAESDAAASDLLASLDFSLEGLPGLLRIVKMFDMVIAKKNCTRFSKGFRVDLQFSRGSNAIRKMIFDKMPGCDSFDIFSKTLFTQRKNDISYFANPKNWIDERIGLHAKLFANTFILANSLSKRISYPTIIVGARGNSGSGKTTALGKLEGILNTDPIKYALREGTEIKNYQIHAEGAMLFDRCFNEISKKIDLSFIVDLRLIRLDDIKTYLLKPAQKRNCTVILHDFDVPLLTSINRILKRDPKGVDPIPSLEPILDGFKGIRKNRQDVIDLAKSEGNIGKYYLYYQGKIVAQKKNIFLEIIDPEGYSEALRAPTEKEIKKHLDTVIDDRYLVEALQRGDFKREEAHLFNDLPGLTVREALRKRASQT